jgi:hypothetical protein
MYRTHEKLWCLYTYLGIDTTHEKIFWLFKMSEILKLDADGNITTANYDTEFQQPLRNTINEFDNRVSQTMDAASYGYTWHCFSDDKLNTPHSDRPNIPSFKHCMAHAFSSNEGTKNFRFHNNHLCQIGDWRPQKGCWYVHHTRLAQFEENL